MFIKRSRKFSVGRSVGIKPSDSVSSSTGTIFSSGSCTKNDFTPNLHRTASAQTERRKKIEKSEISCPFRCSCNDLHLNPLVTGQNDEPLNNISKNLLTKANTNKNAETNSNNKEQIKSNITVVSSSKTIGKTTVETTTTSSATNLVQVLSLLNI
jgi:hypothetical protein